MTAETLENPPKKMSNEWQDLLKDHAIFQPPLSLNKGIDVDSKAIHTFIRKDWLFVIFNLTGDVRAIQLTGLSQKLKDPLQSLADLQKFNVKKHPIQFSLINIFMELVCQIECCYIIVLGAPCISLACQSDPGRSLSRAFTYLEVRIIEL